MVVFLSYNVAGSSTLSGLKQLLVTYRPDYIFLQEVAATREQVGAHLGREYECQVNVEEESSQPGTAVAWRSSLEVEVIPVVTCRMQLARSIHGSFINVYPNTGTKGEAARRVLFKQDLMDLISAEQDVVLVGDWNCIVRREDEEFQTKYSRKISVDLQQLIRDGDFVDMFLKFNPGRTYFTWKRKGMNRSRLDREYYPR